MASESRWALAQRDAITAARRSRSSSSSGSSSSMGLTGALRLLLLVLALSQAWIADASQPINQRHQHNFQHHRATAAGKFQLPSRSLSQDLAPATPLPADACYVSIQWTMPLSSNLSNCQNIAKVLNTLPFSTREFPLNLKVFPVMSPQSCVILSSPVGKAPRTTLVAALTAISLWQLPGGFPVASLPLDCSDTVWVRASCDDPTAQPVALTPPREKGCPVPSPSPPPLPPPPPPLSPSPSPSPPPSLPSLPSSPLPPSPPVPPSPPPPSLPPPTSPRRSPPVKSPPRPPFPVLSNHPPTPKPTAAPALPSTGQATNQGSAMSAADAQAIVDFHNEVRANYGVPPLVWSNDLAAAAQPWASRCEFKHSKLYYGENLAMGSSSAASLARLWYDMEVCSYDYSKPGTFQAGHFTQVVWGSTQRIGCAMVGSSGCPQGILAGDGKWWTGASMLLCEYDPPGNWIDAGAYIANVKRPIMPPAACGGGK